MPHLSTPQAVNELRLGAFMPIVHSEQLYYFEIRMVFPRQTWNALQLCWHSHTSGFMQERWHFMRLF